MDQVTNILDQTLPTELQGIVQYDASQERQEMSQATANTPAVITIEQIRATAHTAAAEETKRLLAEANQAQAVAASIEKLTTDRLTADQRAIKAEADIKVMTDTHKAAVDKLTADLAAATASLATKTTELATAGKSLAEAQAVIAAAALETSLAARASKVDKTTLPDALKAKLKAKAKAAKADGSLATTDAEFDAAVIDANEAFLAGQGDKAPAAGTPAAGTPAPATAAAGTPAPAAPAAPAATPAAPVIPTGTDQATQAIAALLAAPKANTDQVGFFAKNFPLPAGV